MRYVALIVSLFALAFPQAKDKPPMVAPTVKHHEETQTQRYDRVEISCPDGYEGHFVDMAEGFTSLDTVFHNGGAMYWPGDSRVPGYTVCFEKSFMDKIRANPELLRQRPEPPRPV